MPDRVIFISGFKYGELLHLKNIGEVPKEAAFGFLYETNTDPAVSWHTNKRLNLDRVCKIYPDLNKHAGKHHLIIGSREEARELKSFLYNEILVPGAKIHEGAKKIVVAHEQKESSARLFHHSDSQQSSPPSLQDKLNEAKKKI